MSSSVFSFSFACEGLTDKSQLWKIFHQVFIGKLIDPICVHLTKGAVPAQHVPIVGSAPIDEALPDVPVELVRPDLGLLKLRDRSTWLDLSPVGSPAYRQIMEVINAGETDIELLGPVRLDVPLGDQLVDGWFFGQQWAMPHPPQPGAVMRDAILRTRLWLSAHGERAILQFSSHADVWWHLGIYQQKDEGWYDRNADQATRKNVERLARAGRVFLAALPCERRQWSELVDGERPDVGHLMRPVLHRRLGPPDENIVWTG